MRDEFIRVLQSAQHTYEISDLYRKEYGHYNAMKTVMLGDRIFDRAETKEMIILDGTAKNNPELRQANWEKHLRVAFDTGRNL